MNTLNIMNLALAYEAMARCNTGYSALSMLDKIGDLLNATLDEVKQENSKQTAPTKTTNLDDEIPF